MNRFEKIYSQGIVDMMEIWADRETGIQYLWRKCGNSGGFTPLLDKNGAPVVTRGGPA